MDKNIETPNFTVTENAFQRVKTLLSDDTLKDEDIAGLRVYIQGGGCSGFNYGFEFVDDINEEDTVVENADIKVIVDPMSMMYLDGATIDYEVKTSHQQFVVKNPNAKSTCGCGSSFSV